MLEIKKFYSPDEEGASYGYASDDVKVNPFNFGLNAGTTFLTEFKWIPNGGKDGAEQEALEIIFTINDTPKSYRQFPVKEAFLKNSQEKTSDPKHPDFIAAREDFESRMVHILRCFKDVDSIKATLSRRFKDFKEYCNVLASLLPKDHSKIPLDIFLQYSWNIREGQNRTFLEIPSKMKQGRWLCLAQPGIWTEHKIDNPADTVREALWYTNEKDEKHPFTKNGWFMNSNFAKQQKEGGSANEGEVQGEATQSAPIPEVSDNASAPAVW